MTTHDRIDRSRQLYERSVFGGDAGALTAAGRELDAVEADLALARGRILHGHFLAGGTEDPAELPLFERAARLYRDLGDLRGEGEATFWIGCFHQVVRGDADRAVPALQRSLDLAGRAADPLTRSYALRHLGIAEHAAGRLGPARAHLEESVRLRRQLGFDAGVAANLVGLAYLTAAEGHRTEALALLDEAAALAGAADAPAILGQVEQARAGM